MCVYARLIRIGTTSMTVGIEAWVIRRNQTERILVTEGNSSREIVIYAATQAPHEVRLFCSRLLGIPARVAAGFVRLPSV